MRPEPKYTSDSDLESVFSNIEPEGQQKYVCSFKCGQVFKRQVQLDRHEFKHSGIKKHVCTHDDCDKSYTNSQSLKRHVRTFHEKPEKKIKTVKCSFDFCNAMFYSNDNMKKHVREIHENPKVYHCSHCDEKFSQRLKLRRHEVKHTGFYPYKCSKCEKGFLQECFLLRHVCAKTYKCDQCEESFKKWTELLAHRRTKNHNLHKCDKCPKKFTRPSYLADHKNSHEDDKEVYKCIYNGCKRFYSYKRNLNLHITAVHEGKKIPCTFEGCDVTLSNNRALKNHIRAIHTEIEKKVSKPKSGAERLKRKDAGRRKQSTLSKLSGVVIDKEIDIMILEGKTATVDVDEEALQEELLMAIEADDTS